jgi:hypothetical protein
MPYFDDIDVLARYESYADAIASVEKNLDADLIDTQHTAHLAYEVYFLKLAYQNIKRY